MLNVKPCMFVLAIGLFSMCGCNGIAQDAKPATVEGWSERAEKALMEGKASQAIAEMDSVIKRLPDNAQLYIIRGSLKFRSGMIAESLVDFDKVLELDPQIKPFLWQRGISLYYAGKYKEGLDQFNVHREVNPNDVENAFWHFLCNVKLNGLDAAKNDVLLAGYDNREPLMQVQQLIRGKATIEDVVAASERGGAGDQGARLSKFYGYLYIGLYYDSINDAENAKKYLQMSVDQKVPVYMNDVGKIHLSLLNAKK
jgi:lipoprotein NlpI